ncbi:MAG: CBS domain-containing protein [Proteobacteria bacterium]|nr:CBS domain-containing protein [Pseudomonadota bacterium]
MLVRDLMTENVVALQPEEDLSIANDLMAENGIRHLPVIDSTGELLGLISHRDLIKVAYTTADFLPLSDLNQLLSRTRVKEVMVREIETVDPDTSLEDAGMLMMENKFGCIPVCDGTHLVGILTESDFVRYVVSTERELNEVPISYRRY